MKLTLLKSKSYKGEHGKKPLSPYNDKTFLFITIETKNLKESFKYMMREFAFSMPLNLPEKGVITYRRIKDLEEYKPKIINSIALDLDNIETSEQYLNTLEYFKDKDLSVVLGKSRSNNGVDNFNIKGILKVDISSDNAKRLLIQLQSELGDNCKVDINASSLVSIQAPTNNGFILHINEYGRVIRNKDIYVEETKRKIDDFDRFTINYNNDLVDECLTIFDNLGYTPVGSINDNSSINFQHSSEIRSKGGFFWFSSNPLVMYHNNRSRSVNIFHLIKETKVGKEWLKSKTVETQNRLLNCSSINPIKEIRVNERYLNFKKEDKKQLIKDFLKDTKGVLRIKSPMGTAKSDGIKYCIEQSHLKGEKVIIVTNKISVAVDFAEKYGIMLYKHHEATKSTDSLIVQYDSLHKFNLANYDLVVFDEFFSLLLHHRANLTKNANINAVKFKILTEKRRVVIADAFLTGYEEIFFKNRNFYNIINDYRDDIKLYEYKNREHFIGSLLKAVNNLKAHEHLSCSFTSINVMKVVEMELRNQGVKVASLSSETSQITKDIIYEKFKASNHQAFQVLLYTSTLTVGVSNNNENPTHWHYDTGMSTDVISSLQMIKRSRETKEIHYYLVDRQFYYDTDIESLNKNANKHITTFYNNKDKTLLVDIDYETGELSLTPLAIYINSIEVLHNILENHHANAFRSFLGFQFHNKPKIIEKNSEFNLKEKLKEIRKKIREENLNILDKYSDISWSSKDIDYLTKRTVDLSDLQKSILMRNKVKERFPKLSSDRLGELVKIETKEDYKFISKVKNMGTYIKAISDDDYAKYTLSTALANDISSLQNKTHLEFLESCLTLKSKIKRSYSKNELKEIQKENKNFMRFLRKIGYYWENQKFVMDERTLDYVSDLKA